MKLKDFHLLFAFLCVCIISANAASKAPKKSSHPHRPHQPSYPEKRVIVNPNLPHPPVPVYPPVQVYPPPPPPPVYLPAPSFPHVPETVYPQEPQHPFPPSPQYPHHPNPVYPPVPQHPLPPSPQYPHPPKPVYPAGPHFPLPPSPQYPHPPNPVYPPKPQHPLPPSPQYPHPPNPVYPPKPQYPLPPSPQFPHPPNPVYPPKPQYPLPPSPKFPHPPKPVYPPQLPYPHQLGPVHPPEPRYPRIPYQFPCESCKKAASGFTDQLSRMNKIWKLLGKLKDSVEGCQPPPENAHFLVPWLGTLPGPGQTSTASCPAGRTVVSCRCSKENNECHGVTISDDRQSCSAHPASAADTVRAYIFMLYAIVLCAFNDNDEFTVVGPSFDTHHPIAVCPSGSTPIDCWLHTDSKRSTQGSIVFKENKCAVKKCDDGINGICQLWALCKKTIV